MAKRYWYMLALMIILTPLGTLANSTAWGEWGADELQASLGYVPQGFQHMNNLWQALLPDYGVRSLGSSAAAGMVSYVLSAMVGCILIYGLTYLMTKAIAKEKKRASEC